MKLIRSPLAKAQPKTLATSATHINANRTQQIATMSFADHKYRYTIEIAIDQIEILKHQLDVARAFCTERQPYDE